MFTVRIHNVCLFIRWERVRARAWTSKFISKAGEKEGKMRASYIFIQVCSSVENMSIYTIDSSDLNWKLLRSMHILRALVIVVGNSRCAVCSVHVNQFSGYF